MSEDFSSAFNASGLSFHIASACWQIISDSSCLCSDHRYLRQSPESLTDWWWFSMQNSYWSISYTGLWVGACVYPSIRPVSNAISVGIACLLVWLYVLHVLCQRLCAIQCDSTCACCITYIHRLHIVHPMRVGLWMYDFSWTTGTGGNRGAGAKGGGIVKKIWADPSNPRTISPVTHRALNPRIIYPTLVQSSLEPQSVLRVLPGDLPIRIGLFMKGVSIAHGGPLVRSLGSNQVEPKPRIEGVQSASLPAIGSV